MTHQELANGYPLGPNAMEWRRPIVERMAQILQEAADCQTDADLDNLVRRIARNTIRRELGLN